MNDRRRKCIADAQTALAEVIAEIELIASEERAAFDNLPESLQEAERGQAMSEAADVLDEVVSNLGDALDLLFGVGR